MRKGDGGTQEHGLRAMQEPNNGRALCLQRKATYPHPVSFAVTGEGLQSGRVGLHMHLSPSEPLPSLLDFPLMLSLCTRGCHAWSGQHRVVPPLKIKYAEGWVNQG